MGVGVGYRAAAAAATAVALLSAWHSGRHVWRVLARERAQYAAYSANDRRHAAVSLAGLPPEVFDFYASYLSKGDRVYFQVSPSGFSHVEDLPSLVAAVGRYYLLPAVQVTDPARATVVVSYMADPGLLPLHYVTQQRAGLQPIFVSRTRAP